MKKQKPWLGALCVILASVIWGATGLFVRKLSEAGFENIDSLETRALLGAFFTGVYILIRDPKLFRFHLRDTWCFIGAGILNMMMCGITNFYGIQHSSLAIASAMVQTGPMFALIFGCVIFKEEFTLKKLIAITLTFTGCVFASGLSGSERLTTVGFILGIASGIGYSMYSVFGRAAVNRGYNSVTITFYSCVFCAIGCSFFSHWGTMAQAVIRTPSVWVWVVAVGLLDGFVAYFLYTLGLENIETGKASILCSIEMVTNVTVGLLFYHEYLSAPVAIGLLLVMSGIILSSLKFGKRKLGA